MLSKIESLARKKRNKKRFRLGDNEKHILKFIGFGTILVASLAFPNLPLILKPFFKKQGPKKIKKFLARLEEKEIIYLSGDKIQLTKRGRKILEKQEIDLINIFKPAKWDGIWHLVSYDIPNEKSRERDYFRDFLKRLDFYQIQKSLWAYPYNCKEEIALISKMLNINNFVVVMNTDQIPREEQLASYYGF